MWKYLHDHFEQRAFAYTSQGFSLELAKGLGGLGFVLVMSCLLAVAASPALAQSSPLSITITTPAEGETYYISPSAFLYSVYVNGWVNTPHPEPSLIRLRLDIFRGTELAGSLSTRVSPEGAFSFSVTANPEGADFPDHHTGCVACHFVSVTSLPRGKVVLRVTALDPAGVEVIAERRITVDHPVFKIVSVKVVDADQPSQPVPDIPVSASARLYLWRARYGTGVTNTHGQAQVQGEALSQAPTQYVLQVPPTVINGVLYKSVAPTQVLLQPSTSQSETATLQVRAQRGKISGTIRGNTTASFHVRAIDAATGAVYASPAHRGAFAFADLPVTRFIIALDPDELSALSSQSKPQAVELTTAPNAQSELVFRLDPASPRILRGTIRTPSGDPVPFAWVTFSNEMRAERAMPNGAFALYDVPTNAHNLQVSELGFWSESVALIDSSPLSIVLSPGSDIQQVSWGTSAIVVPPESVVEQTSDRLILVNGWVWGNGLGADAIETAGATVMLESARFAIEKRNERALLYVMEGCVVVSTSSGKVIVSAGQMIAIDAHRGATVAVPIDPMAMRMLIPNESVSPDFVIAPSAAAQVREFFAQGGTSLAKTVTFVTYLSIVAALIGIPLAGLAIWRRLLK